MDVSHWTGRPMVRMLESHSTFDWGQPFVFNWQVDSYPSAEIYLSFEGAPTCPTGVRSFNQSITCTQRLVLFYWKVWPIFDWKMNADSISRQVATTKTFASNETLPKFAWDSADMPKKAASTCYEPAIGWLAVQISITFKQLKSAVSFIEIRTQMWKVYFFWDSDRKKRWFPVTCIGCGCWSENRFECYVHHSSEWVDQENYLVLDPRQQKHCPVQSWNSSTRCFMVDKFTWNEFT